MNSLFKSASRCAATIIHCVHLSLSESLLLVPDSVMFQGYCISSYHFDLHVCSISLQFFKKSCGGFSHYNRIKFCFPVVHTSYCE